MSSLCHTIAACMRPLQLRRNLRITPRFATPTVEDAMNSEEQTIVQLVEACWPEEAHLMGPSAVRRGARFAARGDNPRMAFGSPDDSATHLTLAEVLPVLIQALTVAKLALDIYKQLPNRTSKATLEDRLRATEEGRQLE